MKGALRSFIHPEKQTFEAVKDLTFEVPKGQILGFIGANGAGKSTTIKMLTGILKPTSGFCRINGKIPQDNRQDYVKDIGVVFGQRTQLWWDLAHRKSPSKPCKSLAGPNPTIAEFVVRRLLQYP